MFAQRVKIHEHCVANFFRQERHRGTARNHAFQIIPTAAHAAAVSLNQRLHRDRERFFDITRRIDVTGKREHFRAFIIIAAKFCEPIRAAA